MRLISACLFVLSLGFLGGCQQALHHDPMAIYAENPDAWNSMEDLAQTAISRDIDAFMALIPEEQRVKEQRTKIEEIMSLLPDGQLTLSHFYSENRYASDDASMIGYLSSFDVQSENGFAQLSLVVFPHEGECCTLTYIWIAPSETAPSQLNAFRLAEKSPLHWIMFGLLILMPVFHLFTAIACGFNKKVKRKYLWIPFILVGLWGVDFNWTTGAMAFELINISNGRVNFNFLSIHLLGAGMIKAGVFAPWILTIASPVGPLIYWIWARHGKADKSATAF